MIQVAFPALSIENSASSLVYFFSNLELIATTTKNKILWQDELELGNYDLMHSNKSNGDKSYATFKYLEHRNTSQIATGINDTGGKVMT